MSSLVDLLVSYKQVKPDEKYAFVDQELPLDRYNRMLQYILYKDSKKEQVEEETNKNLPENTTDEYGFGGWNYSGMNTTSNKPITTTFKSNKEWANNLANSYRKLGLSENAIRNLISKNALESDWGKSVQGMYNYGNITAGTSWNGISVIGNDHDAEGRPITQKFRQYSNIDEYAKDELNLLKKLYDFDPNDDIDTFTYKLKGGNKGGYQYATAKDYKDRVKKVYNSLN